MALPALENWDTTRRSLHQVVQVVGSIKKAVVEPLPNYAHLGLFVTAEGLTTGRLNGRGEIIINFLQWRVSYFSPANQQYDIDIQDMTQVDIRNAILEGMKHAGFEVHPKLEEITGQSPLRIDRSTMKAYQQGLYAVYTALSHFRNRFLGTFSPMIIFPHGFDLSFLWFKHGSEEKTNPHMNFGFSPGSEGFPRPYIYVYASPLPEAFFDISLPILARFVHEPWKGIMISYDRLVSEEHPETLLVQMLVDIQSAVAPLLV
ncbi:MAG: DUF5996 family protein [Chloroflexi bacterium]|nr:DUF5996 family protein [Chloroflexota bacterium]MCC6894343.1 hypothetical protein [Anaerolineae bacterium]